MPNLKILNGKEVKKILKQIREQWGAKLKMDYGFLQSNKGKVYIVSKDISQIDVSRLRINSVGMYFCEIDRTGIRMSIEGSEIAGKESTKNIAEIGKDDAKKWLKGEDLEADGNYSGFVILKYGDDFLGCGRFKQGTILNYVSKERRISAI